MLFVFLFLCSLLVCQIEPHTANEENHEYILYTVYCIKVKLRDSVCRKCVECQHFKRGQYIKDNSCSRICKDEIKVVDELGEKSSISDLLTIYCNADLLWKDFTIVFLLLII